jgi:hypothetical protein
MKDRLLLAALVCSLPVAAAWLLFRGIQWERRKGFHGRYDQPLEPWVHGDGGRVPTWRVN